jgi:transposase
MGLAYLSTKNLFKACLRKWVKRSYTNILRTHATCLQNERDYQQDFHAISQKHLSKPNRYISEHQTSATPVNPSLSQ